jgi:hypothetical protein
MDIVVPKEMAGAREMARRDSQRRTSRLRVCAENRDHQVMELTTDGFVIEADGRPPLRGYADIFRGEERVLRGLVICSWAEDGLVGYEFKRDTSGGEIRADHAPPAHAGLLGFAEP